VRPTQSGPAQSHLQLAGPSQPCVRWCAPEVDTTPRAQATVRLSVTHRWTERCSVFAERTSSTGGVRPERSRQWGLTREAWQCGGGGFARQRRFSVQWWLSGEIRTRRCVPIAVWTKEGREEGVESKKNWPEWGSHRKGAWRQWRRRLQHGNGGPAVGADTKSPWGGCRVAVWYFGEDKIG
jgi:hypothetical protein